MPERAIFLDRDNTIIDNDGYLGDPGAVKLLQGAATAIASLRRLGYRIIVVSNQSGVARGLFDESAVEAVNQEMCKQLREQAGAHIDASYYCPYHPDAVIAEYKLEHDWRKPKPGMLRQAAEDFNLDLAHSWMVGDAPRDIAAGANAGCRTILIRDPDHPPKDAAGETLAASPNFIVKNLADAARVIVRERGTLKDPVPVPLATTGVSPENGPAAEAPAAPAVDVTLADGGPSGDGALADKIADRLARVQPVSDPQLKPLLEEVVSHLRQRARAADVPPNFSLARMLAAILQVAVAVCLLLGAWNFLSYPDSTTKSYLWDRSLLVISAGVWFLGATVLQGAIISLLVADRGHR